MRDEWNFRAGCNEENHLYEGAGSSSEEENMRNAEK